MKRSEVMSALGIETAASGVRCPSRFGNTLGMTARLAFLNQAVLTLNAEILGDMHVGPKGTVITADPAPRPLTSYYRTTVTIADPAGEVPGLEHVADWRSSDLGHDLVVVATPIRIANEVLAELAERRPRGVIFDIGSLKTPLRSGLERLRAAGCRVTSVHPMFGPDTQLLSGRHVIFVDLGDARALEEARALFDSTMADLVTMSLDEHDRLIAYVLGLSHALNIAFFTALADSGEAAPRLARMSSTTFDAQLDIATRVAAESPELYYEIQSLNQYGEESLAALRAAVERVCQAVHRHDADTFVAIMRQGHDYLRVRQAAREHEISAGATA